MAFIAVFEQIFYRLFFIKHYLVNYVLFLCLLFLYFTKHFLNQQHHGLHSKNLYAKVLLRSSCLTDISYAYI